MIDTGKVVVAFLAPSPGTTHFVGLVSGYYREPVYLIDTGNTCLEPWASSLTREATPEEAIAYWRDRALKAEGKSA